MSAENTAQLVELAQQWMLDDPDADTCAELSELLDAVDAHSSTDSGAVMSASAHADAESELIAELADRFGYRLTFGTAGLRGRVGAGSNRMNSKVVMQTSAGFAEFLLRRNRSAPSAASVPSGTLIPSVVIGFDARLKSEQFAHDAAAVLAGAGIEVTLLPGPVPTPVTAFAVRHLGVNAGVMITASHNPPHDNGYKVYLGDADAGSQIAPPVDAEIAALIDQAASHPLSSIVRSESYTQAGDEVVDAYVAATAVRSSTVQGSTVQGSTVQAKTGTAAVRKNATANGGAIQAHAPLKIVYTAMHGVGYEVTRRVFEAAGLPEMVSVPEQQQPDGRFPTVLFPNPEEPGALDLAEELAVRERADLIIAHDPDADRLAIALPARGEPGRYLRLTGNQLGLLLGWECAERATQHTAATAESRTTAKSQDARKSRGALAATIVSSPALAEVARAYGLDFVQTLSGFKWVSRVPNLIFGFEEALGYLVNPDTVRDKDGISAAVLLAEVAVRLHAEGKTLWDRLDEASERFGYFASDQVTLRLTNADAVEQLSARIRSNTPTGFGEVAVTSFTDFLDEASGLGGMPVAANVLRFDLADGSRVMIRPSGTEPKLKIYLDASCSTGTVAERRTNAEAKIVALRGAVKTLVAELVSEPNEPRL